MPSEKAYGDNVPGEDKSFESPGRGTRPDGSGATSPLNRLSKASSGEVPDRQLNIRSR
jgi:hypothetical protein